MIFEKTEFIFNEHILKMDYGPFLKEAKDKKNKIEEKIKKFCWVPFYKKSKITEMSYFQKEIEKIEKIEKIIDKEYDALEWFFNKIRTGKYCKVEYNENKENYDAFALKIHGRGIEHFELNGETRFKLSSQEGIKHSYIPIMEGDVESEFEIYDYPKIEIPKKGKIFVDYSFSTKMNIGKWDFNYHYTEDPFRINWFNPYKFNFEPEIHYFFGKPGKIYFRMGDAIHNEIIKGCVGNIMTIPEKRENFNMEGKIYLSSNNELIYQGNFDNDGFFPFFILKDKDKNRGKKSIPKIPDSVPVEV